MVKVSSRADRMGARGRRKMPLHGGGGVGTTLFSGPGQNQTEANPNADPAVTKRAPFSWFRHSHSGNHAEQFWSESGITVLIMVTDEEAKILKNFASVS